MTSPALISPGFDENDLAKRVSRKVLWRLIPFLCLLYGFNILDRVNVGFARLTMQKDLGMSDLVFDIGFGLFYFGYLLFEVPSNLLLHRIGARRWIGRIMISWGIVTCGTMFVDSPTGFYIVRILLGVAEAGFFPGIILYLTYWFPDRERARVTAYFMMAIAISNVLGNPISGAIMQFMHEVEGLTGWQWLFLIEGMPSILLGFVVIFWLTDRPEKAHWLNEEERNWLVERMRREEQERQHHHRADRLGALLDWRVWLLICLYFTVAVGSNAAGAYFPKTIEKNFPQLDKLEIGLLTAVPYLCAIVGMIAFSRSSDRTGERRKHVALAAMLAACGWALSAIPDSPSTVVIGFCIAQMGMMSMLPVFWTLPTAFLSGIAAAGGVALINSVANIGGILGAPILGTFGLWSMAITMFIGSVLALCVHQEKKETISEEGNNRDRTV